MPITNNPLGNLGKLPTPFKPQQNQSIDPTKQIYTPTPQANQPQIDTSSVQLPSFGGGFGGLRALMKNGDIDREIEQMGQIARQQKAPQGPLIASTNQEINQQAQDMSPEKQQMATQLKEVGFDVGELEQIKQSKKITPAQIEQYSQILGLDGEELKKGLEGVGFNVNKGFNLGVEIPSITPFQVDSELKNIMTDPVGIFDAVGKTWDSVKGAGKALLNIPIGAVNFGTSLINMGLNPEDTVRGIGTIGKGVYDHFSGIDSKESKVVQGFGDEVLNTLKSPEKIAEFVLENPFDVLSVVSPKTALSIEKGITQGALNASKNVIKTTKQIPKAVEKLRTKGDDYLARKVLGLDEETIKTIQNDKNFRLPDEGGLSRDQIIEEAVSKLDKKAKDLSETGKAYSEIRNKKINTDLSNLEGKVNPYLQKNDIIVGDGGKWDFSKSKIAASKADQKVIQEAYDLATKDKYLTSNYFLNRRSALSDIVDWKKAMTEGFGDFGNKIVSGIRGIFDKEGKTQIAGLKELDKLYAPQIKEISKLKKDYYSVGEIKDNFGGLLKNLTNKGNEIKLQRISDAVPELETYSRRLKAIDDVEKAKGLKVGRYDLPQTKALSAGVGYTVGSMAFGPLGGLAGGLIGYGLGSKYLDTGRFIEKLRKSGLKITPEIEAKIQKVNEKVSEIKKGVQGAVDKSKYQSEVQEIEKLLEKVNKGRALPAPKPTPIPQGGLPQTKAPITPAPLTKNIIEKRNPSIEIGKPNNLRNLDIENIKKENKIKSDKQKSIEDQKKQEFETNKKRLEKLVKGYDKLPVTESIPSRNYKDTYTTNKGDIKSVSMDRGREIFEIGGQKYRRSEIDIYKKKESVIDLIKNIDKESLASKKDTINTDKRKSIGDFGDRKGLNASNLLDDIGIKQSDIKPEDMSEFLDLVNARKFDSSYEKKYNTFKEKYSKNQSASKELEPIYKEAKKYKSAEEFLKKWGETLYHGSDVKFDKFDKSKMKNGRLGKGAYFTPDKKLSKTFGKVNMEFSVIPNNLFKVKGNSSSDVLSEIKNQFPEANEFNIAEILQKNGFDGIDYTDWDKGRMVSIFDPNIIKTKPQLKQIREEANKIKKTK